MEIGTQIKKYRQDLGFVSRSLGRRGVRNETNNLQLGERKELSRYQ